jgi:UDP-N-acetylmuramate--alanine ligase
MRDLGDANARDGAGRVAIVEADEYAEAFLQYEPRIGLITNIEADHLDYYGTPERLARPSWQFSRRVQPDGTLVVCADNPWAAPRRGPATPRALVWSATASTRGRRVARDEGPRQRPRRARLHVLLDRPELGRLSLGCRDGTTWLNALGALAASMRGGVDFHRAAQAAAEFLGARDASSRSARPTSGRQRHDHRRLRPPPDRGPRGALRRPARFPKRRLVPASSRTPTRAASTCWRTSAPASRASTALPPAHLRGAREPDRGMDARALAARSSRPRPVYLDTFEEATERIAGDLEPGDVFFTIGAGDVTELGPMVLERLDAEA